MAGVIDDITQQGFSRRYYLGTSISMEPLSPFSSHRFRPLPNPKLQKGPSDWRNTAIIQALGINFVQALVLYHAYSSIAALHLLPLFCSVFIIHTNTKFSYFCHLPVENQLPNLNKNKNPQKVFLGTSEKNMLLTHTY